MAKTKRVKYRVLIKILKKYDITVITKRGKGSERMLYQEKTRLNYPIKHHGDKTEYGKGMIAAIKRRFNLPDNFLDK